MFADNDQGQSDAALCYLACVARTLNKLPIMRTSFWLLGPD